MSEIIYTEEKKFTKSEVEELFLSVGWVSGKYPERLYRALLGSSTVITAWVDGRLVGLARALDDGAMLAYLHYILVAPAFQGRGIAGRLVELLREKYRDYPYIELMPEDEANVPFYERHGFERMKGGTPMLRVNFPANE